MSRQTIIKSASFARNLDDRASVVYLHEGDLNGRDSVTQFNTSEEHRERGITALSGFILSECGVSEE